jgi:hypothetical protein
VDDRPGARLAALIRAWVAILDDPDLSQMRELLDERVTWQGLLPELICHDRREVLALFQRQRSFGLRITRLEAEEVGDRVLLSVEGPELAGIDGVIESGAPRSLAFTFADGMVVHIASYASRAAAFAAFQWSWRP